MSVELTVVPGIRVSEFDGYKSICSGTRLHFMWKAGDFKDFAIANLAGTTLIAPSDIDPDYSGKDCYGDKFRECDSLKLAEFLESMGMNEHPADKANIQFLKSMNVPCLLHFH